MMFTYQFSAEVMPRTDALVLSKIEKEKTEPIVTYEAPHFTNNFKDLQVIEGGKACFEARLSPTDDNLKIDWLKDGLPMKMGTIYFIRDDMKVCIAIPTLY
jgi:hypothetical protein